MVSVWYALFSRLAVTQNYCAETDGYLSEKGQ